MKYLKCKCGNDEFIRTVALIVDENNPSQERASVEERGLICQKCRKKLNADEARKHLNE